MADISYGRVIDGKDEWAQLKKVTPSTNNLTLDSNEKIDNFRQNDSLGIGMTITAMAVVFLGLFLLYIIFKQIGRLSISASKRNAQKAAGTTSVSVDAGQESGEIFAAIATALYEMSDDNHDIEPHRFLRSTRYKGLILLGVQNSTVCVKPHISNYLKTNKE